MAIAPTEPVRIQWLGSEFLLDLIEVRYQVLLAGGPSAVAKAAGVSERSLSRLLTLDRKPYLFRSRTLLALFRALGLDPASVVRPIEPAA